VLGGAATRRLSEIDMDALTDPDGRRTLTTAEVGLGEFGHSPLPVCRYLIMLIIHVLIPGTIFIVLYIAYGANRMREFTLGHLVGSFVASSFLERLPNFHSDPLAGFR